MNDPLGSASGVDNSVNHLVDKTSKISAPPGHLSKTSFGQGQGQGPTVRDSWTPQSRIHFQANDNTIAASQTDTQNLALIMAANRPTDADDGDPGLPLGQLSGDMDIDVQHDSLEQQQHNIQQEETLINNIDIYPQNTTHITQPPNIVNNPPSFDRLLAPAPLSVAHTPVVANNAGFQLNTHPGYQQAFQRSVPPLNTPVSSPMPFGNGPVPAQTTDFKFMPPSHPGTPMIQYQTPVPRYQAMRYPHPQVMQHHNQARTQYNSGLAPAQAPQYLPQQRYQTPTPMERLQRPPSNHAEEKMMARHQAERTALLHRQAGQYDAPRQWEYGAESLPVYRPHPPPPPPSQQAYQQALDSNTQARNHYQSVQQSLQPYPTRIHQRLYAPSQPTPDNEIKSEGAGTSRDPSKIPSLVPEWRITRQAPAVSMPNMAHPRAMSAAPQPQRMQVLQAPNGAVRYALTSYNQPAFNNRIAADLAAHQLVQAFVNRYRNNDLAINTFYRLSSNFNNNIISEHQFYVDTCKLFWMLGSHDLMIPLYCQRPYSWRHIAIQPFHQNIQNACNDEVFEIMCQRIMATGRMNRLMGGAEVAPLPAPINQVDGPTNFGPQHTTETKIVNLKLPQIALQNFRQSGSFVPDASSTPANNAIDDEPKAAADFADFDGAANGGAGPWDNNDFADKSALPKKSKKRVPVKGYRTNQDDLTPNVETDKVNKRKSLPTRSVSTSNQVQPAPSSPLVVTPAQDSAVDVREDDEDENENGEEDEAEDDDEDGEDGGDDFNTARRRGSGKVRTIGPQVRAKRAASRGTSKLPGKEVPHVGDIYKTRRAILAREDKPYIHDTCGQGFKHPDDVRKHHNQNCDSESKSWNDHASCKIMLSQLQYCKVADGFVILDQASLDKIQDCCDKGRASNLKEVRQKVAKGKKAKSGHGDIDEELDNELLAMSAGDNDPDVDDEAAHDAQTLVNRIPARGDHDLPTSPFTIDPSSANPFAANALVTKSSVVSKQDAIATPTDKKNATPNKTKTPKSKTPKKTIPSKRAQSDAKGGDDEYSSAKKPPVKRQVVKAGPD